MGQLIMPIFDEPFRTLEFTSAAEQGDDVIVERVDLGSKKATLTNNKIEVLPDSTEIGDDMVVNFGNGQADKFTQSRLYDSEIKLNTTNA